MKVTFIVRDLTAQAIDDLAAMDPRSAYAKLQKWAFGDLRHCVSVKFGNCDAFRDRVAWNGIFKSACPIAFAIEPRRGYRLVTFTEAPR